MTKIKRIAAGALATIVVTTGATFITASADKVMESNAVFEWSAGYSKLTNQKTVIRRAIVSVEANDNVTGAYLGRSYKPDNIGYGESVEVNNLLSRTGVLYTLRGTIYEGGSDYSPISAEFEKYSVR